MNNAPKRSLFNRPAWAAKTTSTQEKENAVFGRHSVYNEVVELEKKKQLRRDAKAKEREERQKEKARRAENHTESEPETKKRRISRDVEEEGGGSETETSREAGSSREDVGVGKDKDRIERMTRSAPRKPNVLENGLDSGSRPSVSPLPKKTVVIEIGDEESDLVQSKSPKVSESDLPSNIRPSAHLSERQTADRSQGNPDPESEESDDDEYMRALRKKARERARERLNAEKHTPVSPSVDARSPSVDQHRPNTAAKSPSTEAEISDIFGQPKQIDPEVSILINSSIPNTKSLIVSRRASQPLQLVKNFWCARQGFNPTFSAKVFLTWRETKLFNSSTMRTVLRQLKKEMGYDLEASEDPSRGRVVVEAMTQEIYDERLKAKARKLTDEATGESQSQHEDALALPLPSEPRKKEGIVIRLTSAGLDSMPLRVRPHTSIDKIMRAFQSQRGVDAAKRCWLVFDGDKLEPDISVEDAGFEDGDEIEVYPR